MLRPQIAPGDRESLVGARQLASVAGLKRRIDGAWGWGLYLFRAKVLGRRVERPPIVIAGCGHSGTTLLLSILDAHSAIFAVPYEARLGRSDPPEFRKKAELFDRLTIAAGKARWVEKTTTNTLYLNNLFQNSPALKVIVIVRDGRDVTCSMAVRFQHELGGRGPAFAHGLDRWTNENTQWLKHKDHPRLLAVKYEDLVRDFDVTLRKITDFVGESWEPGLQEFHRSDRNYLHYAKVDSAPPPIQGHIHELRNWQVHRPLFDGSGRWQTEMSDDEKRAFKEKAGQLLLDFGYAENLDW